MLIYDVAFTASTDDLKKTLGDLQKEVKLKLEIDKDGTRGSFDAIKTQGAAASQFLQNALQKATSIDGTSLSRFNSELQKSGVSAAELARLLSNAGMTQNLSTLTTTIASADTKLTVLNDHIKEMHRVLSQSVKFRAAMAVQDFLIGQGQAAIQWTKDMNQGMIDIQVVSEKTGKQMEAVFDNVIKKSKELETTAKEYSQAALIYYQQGLDDEEVTRRTDITIKAARAAGEDAETMSKNLTAIWNTYQMQGDRLQNAASIAARLGADTAVDFAYIAEAMQTSATAAAQMGLSYENLAAIIATVGETTMQASSVVGNAFKTIISRFDQLKATGTDGEVTLGRISQQLDDLGIHILDTAGELKSMDQIIFETGDSWEQYSQKQQIAIAEVLGGTRQFGQVLALFNNWDKFLQNSQTAFAETGDTTLEDQFAVASESIQVTADMAGEAWQRAFGQLANEDALSGFYAVLKAIGEQVEVIISAFGGLPGILALVGAAFSKNIIGAIGRVNTGLIENAKNMKYAAENNVTISQASKQRQLAEVRDSLPAGSSQQRDAVRQMDPRTIAYYDQLNEKIRTGTELQKAAAQAEKDRFTQLQLNVSETDQKLETLAKKSQDAIDKSNAAASTSKNKMTPESENLARITSQISVEISPEDKARIINELQTSLVGYPIELDIQEDEEFEAYIQRISQELQTLKSESAGLMDSANGSLQEAQGNFDKVTKEILDLEDEIAKLEAEQAKILEGDITDESAARFDELSDEIANLTDDLSDAQEALEGAEEGLRKMGKAAQDTARITESVGNVSDEVAANLGEAGELLESFGNDVSNAEDKLRGFQTVEPPKFDLAQATQGLLTFSMGIISVVNTIGMLAEGELTFQKIGQAAMTLMLTLPMMISGFSALTGAITANTAAKAGYVAIQQIANTQNLAELSYDTLKAGLTAANIQLTGLETQAELVNTAEKLKNSGADLVKIGTEVGLMAAIKATTGAILAQAAALLTNPVTWIILGIVAAIALLVAAFKALERQSPEYKLAQAKKEAENLNQALSETKERADAIRQSFEKYDNAVKALDECQKGTQAWKDALKAVNEEALDILSKYPDLAKMDGLFTRDSKTGMLTMNADMKDQVLKDQTSAVDTAQYAAMLGQLRVSEAQLAVDTKSLISDMTPWWQDDSFNRAIIEAASQWSELTDEEYAEAVRKLLDDSTQFADGIKEGIVETAIEYKDEVQGLADQISATAKQMKIATQLIADNQLGDAYSAAAKNMAAEDMSAYTAEREQYWKDMMDKDWQADDQTSNSRAVWAMYNQATGQNLEAHSNQVRGNDDNRTYAYWADGEVKEVTKQQIATTIAAYEALEKLTQNAEEASQTLATLDERAKTGSATELGVDAVKKVTAEQGFGDYTKKELDQLKAEIAEAGGMVEYLQNQTGMTIEQIADTFGADFVENFTESLKTNWDNIKLPDLPGLDELAYDAAAKMDNIFQGDFFQGAVTDAYGAMETDQLVTTAAGVADVFKQAMTDKLKEVPEAARADMLNEISNLLQSMPPEMRTLDLVTKLTEVENIEEFREYVEGQLEFAARFAPREDASNSIFTEEEAKTLDYATDSFKEFSRELREAAIAKQAVNKEAKVTTAAINGVAEGALKAAYGVNELAEAYENYQQDIKPANKGTAAYIEGMTEMRKAMAKVLDIADDALSMDFMAENMDLMKEAAEGSAEAIEELRIAAAEDILTTVMMDLDPNLTPEGLSLMFGELQGLVDGLNLEAGMTLDTGDALAALEQFIISTGMTVDQANTLFEAMGYDVELKPVESTTESVSQMPQTRAVTLGNETFTGTIHNADGTTSDITASVPQWGYEVSNIDIPATEIATATGMEVTADGSGGGSAKVGAIESITKKAGGGTIQSARPAVGGGGSSGKGSGAPKKGGGGGGSKPKEKGKIQDKDDPVVVRYENIENVIEDLTREIEKMSTAEEHLFGTARLNLMQKKQKELLKLAAAQAKYAAEARKYYQIDRADFLENLGDNVAEFDKYGFLTNIEGVREHWQREQEAAYKEMEDIYNKLPDAMSEADEATLKSAEERYKARKEYIDLEIKKLDQLLETEAKVKEQIDAATETFRAMMQLKLDEASYKMNLRIEITDMDLKYLDYLLKRIDRMGASARKTSSFFDNLNSEIRTLIKQSTYVAENVERLNEIMNNVEDSSPHKNWFLGQLGNQGYSAEDANAIWDNFQDTGRMDADIIDLLMEDADKLLEINQALFDAMYSAWDHYIDTFNEFMDKFDDIVGRYESLGDRINNINGLLSVFGMTSTRNAQQVKNLGVQFQLSGEKMAAYKVKAEEAAAWAADAKSHLDYALASGNQDLINEAERAYDEMQKTADEAYDDYLASLNQFAQDYVEIWGQMVDKIVEDFSAKIFPLATSMDTALEALNLQREVTDFWLDEYQSAYQYDRLLKKIADDSDSITDPKQRALYDEIQGEILKKQEEGALVTAKDVELWEKRLNVAKEQAAFEESLVSKNTMRLARDASGNWSYVYSDDAQDSDDAGDKKAEAEYDYYTAVKNAIEDYSQKLRETEAASLQYYQERAKQRALINAEDTAALEKFDAETKAQMDRYTNLILWYAGKIDEYAGYIGLSHEEMSLTITSGYNSAMEEALAYLNGIDNILVPELNAAETQMRDDAALYLGQIGVSFQTLGDIAQTEMERIKREAELLTTKLKATQESSQRTLQQMSADMRKLMEDWVGYIDAMIKANEALYESIRKLAGEMAGIGDGVGSDSNLKYDAGTDYAALIGQLIEDTNVKFFKGENSAAALDYIRNDPYLSAQLRELEALRDAKIQGEGLSDIYGDDSTQELLDWISAGSVGWDGSNWVYWDPVARKRVKLTGEQVAAWQAGTWKPPVLGYSTGGLVPGVNPSDGDSVPAMLTPAEYVLNPEDTQAFFRAFHAFLALPNFDATAGKMNPEDLQQMIQIYADFPNVSSRDEIQAALNNLINQAKQYNV